MAFEISGTTPSTPVQQAPARTASPAPAPSAAPPPPTDRANLSGEAISPETPGPTPNFAAPIRRGAASRQATSAAIRERGQQAEAAGGEEANEGFRQAMGGLADNLRSAVGEDARQNARDAVRSGDVPGAVRAGSAIAGEKVVSRATRGLQVRACLTGAVHGARLGVLAGPAVGVAAGLAGCAAGYYTTRTASEVAGNVVGQTTHDVGRRALVGP